MIMRKSPRNDVENPPGQIINPVSRQEREEALDEMVRISEELGLYDNFLPVNQGKPLVKELSEYEELLRKNNSENSR